MHLRNSIYPETDIFILCFNITNPDSLRTSRDIWSKELRKYSPGIPVILVGTKLDLREDRNTIEKLREKKLSPITFSQGEAISKEIGAVIYMGNFII